MKNKAFSAVFLALAVSVKVAISPYRLVFSYSQATASNGSYYDEKFQLSCVSRNGEKDRPALLGFQSHSSFFVRSRFGVGDDPNHQQ